MSFILTLYDKCLSLLIQIKVKLSLIRTPGDRRNSYYPENHINRSNLHAAKGI